MKYRKLPLEIEAAKWDGSRLNGEHPWHFLGMKNWYRGSPSDNLVIETQRRILPNKRKYFFRIL
jgi:hypothetical protein